MNFAAVFKLIIENFQKQNINFALIGGFAMHTAGFTRATQDIDLLVASKDVPKVKRMMSSYGYELIYESEDVLNFLSRLKELGKVDFLIAHRRYANAMLERAQNKQILSGEFMVKVISAEDIIGLKVQSSSNDQARYHLDMADIESLIRINYKNLNMKLIEEYFALFNREEELRQILENIKDA